MILNPNFRIPKWVLLLVSLPLFCCCWLSGVGLIVIPDIIGYSIAAVTRYGNTELLYSGSNECCSGEWSSKAFVFWTTDSVDNVRAHYERSFGQLQLTQFNDLEYYDAEQKYEAFKLLVGFADDYRPPFDVDVYVLDADQSNRSQPLDMYYKGDPYSIVDQAPRQGTLIIEHLVFSP